MADSARRVSLAAALLALAAVAAGCCPRSVALYEKVMGSPSYGRVTEAACRAREVHDGLDTRFILSATWLSEPWVSAFAEEYSNIYYLDTARREDVIPRWRGESEKYVRFFVALYVPEEKGNDLEKPGTLWSLRLGRGASSGSCRAWRGAPSSPGSRVPAARNGCAGPACPCGRARRPGTGSR